MPSGVVQAIGKSRSGKPTVTVGGQIYSASKLDLSGLQVGDTIEMDTASSVYNGATVWFLNAYKVTQAAIPAPVVHRPPPQNAAPRPPETSTGISEGERLTISNWVAAAIQAGIIKEPVDMGIWAASACQAIRFAGTTWPKNSLGERLEAFMRTGADPDEKIPF